MTYEDRVFLTRTQSEKISKIFDQYPGVNLIEIRSSSPSGIGPEEFVHFDNNGINMVIDITDVDSW